MQEPQISRNLSAETDDLLVSLSAEGNEEATAILIVRYLGVIHKIAARFTVVGVEHEDFVQEGMIGFLSAIRTYHGDRNCSFNTYARICVLNRIKKAVDFASTKKYSLLSRAMNLETAKRGQLDYSADPERLVLEQEAMDWFFEEMGQLLSDSEMHVFLPYLEGYEPAQIAQMLGLAPKSVYNALGRVRKKLRSAFQSNQNS